MSLPKPLIRTFTGRLVDPFDLQEEDIVLEDIAHALANQCRFTGHVRSFYSVGEHCIRGVNRLGKLEHQQQFLLHDAAEAYLLDLPAPIKNHSDLGRQFKLLETEIKLRIYARFGIGPVDYPEVEAIDKDLCRIEKASLMNNSESVCTKDERITYTLLPGTAKRLFIKKYNELFVDKHILPA